MFSSTAECKTRHQKKEGREGGSQEGRKERRNERRKEGRKRPTDFLIAAANAPE